MTTELVQFRVMQYLCTGYVGQENIIASATSGRSTSLKNIQVWQCLMDDQYACSYTTYQANFLLPRKCWPSTTNAIVCKRCMYLHTIVYVCVCVCVRTVCCVYMFNILATLTTSYVLLEIFLCAKTAIWRECDYQQHGGCREESDYMVSSQAPRHWSSTERGDPCR